MSFVGTRPEAVKYVEKRARKEYLAFAKSRKHTAKKIRSALRRQLEPV